MDWQLFGTIMIQAVLGSLIFCILSLPVGFGVYTIRRGFTQKTNPDTLVLSGKSDDD